MSTKRQKGVSKGKSLGELIASGGFRADRHWRLVLEGSKPDGVPEHAWREIVSNAKAHVRKKMGEERRRAETLLASTELTPDEIAVYERLLAGLPQPEGEITPEYVAFIDGLRRRPDYEKKMHVRVGTLSPHDRFKADELAGVEPVRFETWQAFFAAHPEGRNAPLRFTISNAV